MSLGWLPSNGPGGVDRDVARVVDLYELRIEEGQNIRAMYYLGRLLRDGDRVRRHAGRAVKVLERAVEEHGDVEARGRRGCSRTR